MTRWTTGLIWIVQRLLFPAWLVAAAAVALWLYRPGNAPLLVAGTGLATLLLVAALERAMPFQAAWNRSQGDTRTDLISFGLIAAVFDPLWKILGTALALWLLTMPALAPLALPAGDLPLWLQVVLVFLIAEFGKYWAHRWHHESRLLWDLHAMHHVSRRLYLFNNFKLHPVNHLISYFFSLFPLVLLGMPEQPLLVYSTIFVATTFFQHANIDLHFGPLNYLLSTSALHRWHHSAKLPEGNRNYGSVLIIWDILFGTFYHPARRQAPDRIGIDQTAFPEHGYLRQVLWPLTRRCCPR